MHEALAAGRRGGVPARTDAGPAREVLTALRLAGATWKGITHGCAAVAGVTVTEDHLQHLITSSAPTMSVALSDAILLLPGRVVTWVGVQRRLQALVAAGWPVAWIIQLTGLDPKAVYRVLDTPTGNQDVYDRIARVYDQISVKIPEDFGVLPQSATRARRRAAAAGWVPPIRWDDQIDDPTLLPEKKWVPPAAKDRIGNVVWLVECGESVTTALDRNGWTGEGAWTAFNKACRRHKLRDVAARLRRLYLSQNPRYVLEGTW